MAYRGDKGMLSTGEDFHNLATAEASHYDQYEQSDQSVDSSHFCFWLSCCKFVEIHCIHTTLHSSMHRCTGFMQNIFKVCLNAQAN